MPPEICITTQKPDIVILDEKQKIIHMFELSVPIEHNIEQRHTEKANKYTNFTTYCTGYKCNVTAFEIGSRGYISTRNHSKPGIKLRKFKENISALAVYSSYHIFITRIEEALHQPPFLPPHFNHL